MSRWNNMNYKKESVNLSDVQELQKKITKLQNLQNKIRLNYKNY